MKITLIVVHDRVIDSTWVVDAVDEATLALMDEDDLLRGASADYGPNTEFRTAVVNVPDGWLASVFDVPETDGTPDD